MARLLDLVTREYFLRGCFSTERSKYKFANLYGLLEKGDKSYIRIVRLTRW